MLIVDPSAAAARFLPFAAMSALAYAEDRYCDHKPKISEEERLTLEQLLNDAVGSDPRWTRMREIELAGACEDNSGLYYQVWYRDVGDTTEVVIAFRGTWGSQLLQACIQPPADPGQVIVEYRCPCFAPLRTFRPLHEVGNGFINIASFAHATHYRFRLQVTEVGRPTDRAIMLDR